ncbi:group II truncated hemoglobin [Methylocaldum sp. GT1BB]|uniref:group II truncated hemoglobin n=1 Tax=Methylocaldum sp. GT1BB TaxID=3438963 RepID=UPI003DA0513A
MKQSPTLPLATAVTLPASVDNPHYRQIGGEQAVRRLVERFYQLMDELPEARAIRAMHPPDLAPAKEKLFLFLSGWLGGPPLYAERHGPPRLRQKHLPFPIDTAARDAWMACMNRALEEQVSNADLRAQLAASFFKTADFLRNQP